MKILNKNQEITWAEINLSHLAHNLREVQRIIPRHTRIMAVVKANAYGHGAPRIARVLSQHTAYLATARLEEALELRETGLGMPILVFGYVPPPLIRQALRQKITLTIFDPLQANDYAREARKTGQALEAHLKIDTGMGRLGLPALPTAGDPLFDQTILQQIADIHQLPGIKLSGIYSHFAQADHRDKQHARGQLSIFTALIQSLQEKGYTYPLRHIANSAGIIDIPEAHLDMVRPGIMLYGLYPSQEVDRKKVCLKPVMSLKARITQVKKVAPGFKVSYGSTFTAKKNTRIACIALGYADGFPRILSSKGVVMINGQQAPVIGRVCMDQTMVDIGHIPTAKPGDVALVFGEDKGCCLPVETNAELAKTINYELVSGLLPRVKRIYLD